MTDKTPPGERIAKVLARAGVASRREAERMIEAGRVTVNGQKITSPALNVTPVHKITVDGAPLAEAEPPRIWLYHKPTGLVTTARDEKGRETVFDALPEGMPRVMSVGRLDLNSEGLLLLTNDGEVKRKLELPATGWLRRYRVRVHGRPDDAAVQPLRDGLTVDGERFQPMQVTLDRQQGANAWLTVALSCEILALAWIWSKVQLHQLRQIAAGVTLIVIARLVFNPMILDYDGQVFVVFGWVLYGYGIPAVASFLAAGIFARKQTDAVTTLCEVAAAGFAFLMVALQLRLWTAGSIAGAPYQLYDEATQSIWWITSAGLLAGEAKRQRRQWTGAAGFGLLLLSLVAVVVLHIISLSPVISGEPVGKLPVLNLLALAYLVPAVLFMVVGRSQRFLLAEGMRQLLELASGLLVFVYITLETRRAFWGTYIALTRSSEPTNAEFYAYSAIWILFALCLLFIGIIRTSVPLRYASLVVLMVTVAKVFLFDMSDLTGLFRVASFLGLGLTLIAPASTGPSS